MAPEPSSSEPSPDALYDKYSINCWSGPRCCSTSLMYSFAQRSDTAVLDEPLYASYLRLSGVDRPYLDLVLAAQENDGNKVVDSQILGPRATKVSQPPPGAARPTTVPTRPPRQRCRRTRAFARCIIYP